MSEETLGDDANADERDASADGSGPEGDGRGGTNAGGSGGSTDQAIRDLAKGAGVVYVGLVVEVVIAFLAQVLAARYLSTGGFGGITTGTALLNIGAIVSSVGFGEGMARYLPRLPDERKRAVARAAFLLGLPVAIVVGGVFVLFAEPIATRVFGDPTVAVSLRIFGAAIPFSTATVISIGGIRGQKQSRYRVYVENILQPTVRFGLVVVAVTYGLDQAGVAGAYAVPYVVGSALAVYYCWRVLPAGESGLDRSLLGEFVGYSAPFVVTGAANFIYRSIDVFLVLYFLDSEAVGVYGVAYAAAQLIIMFSAAFNFIGTPVASEVEASGGRDEMLRVQNAVLRWLVIASIPALAPLVFYPADFISVVYRPAYAEGAATLALLALGFAVHNVLNAQANLLQALGNSRELAINNTVAAAVNVGLNVVLIPKYGIFGAAVATVIAYMTIDALTVLELRYYLGRFTISRRVVAPVLVALPLFGATALLAPDTLTTLAGLIAFGAAFAVAYLLLVLFALGLNAEEVMLVRSAEERFGVTHPLLDAFLDRFS
ncbi:flippase [Halomarina pelagica]|uniref:flippase n=1 Tax=Halomarina pelagica TaxID=2961599 RepID=UPI0020C48D07|nr:flippase [Halomarina sp. BND7]